MQWQCLHSHVFILPQEWQKLAEVTQHQVRWKCEWNLTDVNTGSYPKHASASPTPKKAYTPQAQAKTMVNCFYHKGTVPSEFLACQTMNQHCYLEILAGLCETLFSEDLNFGLMLRSCVMMYDKIAV